MNTPDTPDLASITKLVDLVINSAQNVIHAGDSGVDVRQSILDADRDRLLRQIALAMRPACRDQLPGELITAAHALNDAQLAQALKN